MTFSAERFKQESAREQAALRRDQSAQPVQLTYDPAVAYQISYAGGIPIEAGRIIAALEQRITELEKQLGLQRKSGWHPNYETR